MEHNWVKKRHGSFIYPPMGLKVDVELPSRAYFKDDLSLNERAVEKRWPHILGGAAIAVLL